MPELDDTGKQTVSLYGKNSSAGDTPLAVDSSGVLKTQLTNLSCGKLEKGIICEKLTLTNANSDYAVASPMPSTTKYISVYCDNDSLIAMGEATSTTKGIGIVAGSSMFAVVYTGVTADDKLHCQSPTAGTVVIVSYLTE
jgi:hypothetical protein